MQDVFIEYMVKKRRSGQTALLKVAVWLAAVVVFFFAVFVLSYYLGPFSFLGVLLGAGAIYGAYYLSSAQNVEFEYSVTNGEMDVDKIVAQRKRRRLASINMREVENFGRYKASEHANREYQNKIFACDYPENEDLWFCVCRPKDKGVTLVVFNASERMLEGIKPFLPRQIMHEAFRIR